MKCEEYQVLIEDYADGSLDQKSAARVTSHTATCAACASFYQAIVREQELYARYQRDVEVTHVLWASIESRIKQERVVEPAGLASRLREHLAQMFSAPRLSPAFAAALVVVAIGTTVFVMSRLNPHAPKELASGNSNASVAPSGTSIPNANLAAPAPETSKPGNTGLVAGGPTSAASNIDRAAPSAVKQQRRATAMTPAQLVRDAEYKYLTAIAMLSRDVNGRRSQLDPVMLARFDASLAEIDRTIKETRQVVRGNPGDPIALQYLLAAYSKKVDVLREMTNN